MLQRRSFMRLVALLGLSPYLGAEENVSKAFDKVASTIATVQDHMFPVGAKLPSSKQLNLTHFLKETLFHASFDKDIRAFVIDGAKELELQEKGRFTKLSFEEREKALRKFESWHYGASWLSRIMTLSMEGMFSDPIYGANRAELGWKAVGTYGGFPRPKQRYIDV